MKSDAQRTPFDSRLEVEDDRILPPLRRAGAAQGPQLAWAEPVNRRPTRVLGHVHTFNDEDVIDRSLDGLLAQTYPVEEIVVVDNGSTDGTLEKLASRPVTLFRHPENLGTSGSVATGMRYALEKQFDWIWILDADSRPRNDALEELMALYHGLPPELQRETRLLASLPVDATNQMTHHGIIFTPNSCTRGFIMVQPDPRTPYYECDSSMWSGSLFNLKAVRHFGLPPEEYVLDWGDYQYGYLGKMAGYRAFMSQRSIIDHNLHIIPTLRPVRLGPLAFRVFASPPIRRYYFFRNFTYFWFHEFRHDCFMLPYFHLLRLMMHLLRVCLFRRNSLPELSASLRGLWDGLRAKIHHRYY